MFYSKVKKRVQKVIGKKYKVSLATIKLEKKGFG
jgi:hypothetical protein